MSPKLQQTIHSDRLRIAMPWAAWLATFALTASGVWVVSEFKSDVASGIKSANELGKAAIQEIQGLRMELKETRSTLEEHEIQIREHRVIIRELQRRSGTGSNANGWGEE